MIFHIEITQHQKNKSEIKNDILWLEKYIELYKVNKKNPVFK